MDRVLFIDDDPDIRRLISSALEEYCEVISAESGEEGIAKAIEYRPSVVLIDIMLPGLNGYDVVMKLRQIEALKDVPIFAVSAYGGEDEQERARALGFDDYLAKPLDIGRFQRLITAFLSGNRQASYRHDIDPTFRDYSVDLINRLQMTIEDLKSEKKFTESIIQSLSSGLMVIDPDGMIVTINPEGLRILSLFSETVKGKKLAEVLGEEAAKKMTEISKEVLFFRNEITLRTIHGDERVLGFTTVPRINASGRMVGLIVSFRDITDIQLIQKEMEKINRLSTMAEIASAVAHEIRNPLAGIKTMAQSIDENLGETDENKEYTRRIIKQVDRLNEILKGFFTYSRPPKPRITRASLIDIVQEVKPLVSKKLQEKGIVLVENYEKDMPMILADPNQIQQVFLNLILNAIDAISSGGRISITGRSLNPPEHEAYSLICPALKEHNHHLMVTFRDNGSGMSKETVEKIFEPFFTTKCNGSGLGLSIVYRVLQENNAAIFCDSAEGVGTTFLMFFETEKKWEKFSL